MIIKCNSDCCEDGLILEGRIIEKDNKHYFQTAGDEWLVKEKHCTEMLLYVPYPMCGSIHFHKVFTILEV